jgi:hypothetical protein
MSPREILSHLEEVAAQKVSARLPGAANYESVKENLFPVYVGQPSTIRKDIAYSPEVMPSWEGL